MHAPLCTPEATLASCFRAAQVHYSCHYGRTRGRIGLARRVAAAYVCIDIFIYIYIYTHIYIYIYIYIYLFVYIHANLKIVFEVSGDNLRIV